MLFLLCLSVMIQAAEHACCPDYISFTDAAGWGCWLNLYKQTPSRKCSARLDGLAVNSNLAYLNHVRRVVYDSMEAHLTSGGLNIGER